MGKPLTKPQRRALEYLTNERLMADKRQRWIMSPDGALLGMLTRLSKRKPPLVEYSGDYRLFVRITKQGRAVLAAQTAKGADDDGNDA